MSFFLWNELDQNWDTTEEYWIIEKIIGGGGGGDAAQWFGNYQKLDKEEKRKVIRLVMIRNGIKFEQSKEIREDDYTVTAKDIKELVEEYLEEKKKLKMHVTEVTMDIDDSEWGQ
jgi:hypothetical protein